MGEFGGKAKGMLAPSQMILGGGGGLDQPSPLLSLREAEDRATVS